MVKNYICRYCGRHFKNGLGKHELACSQKLGVEFIPRSKLRNSNSMPNFPPKRYAKRKESEFESQQFDLEFVRLMLQIAEKMISKYTD